MKDRWKFCQCCYLNGHCENQDRGMKCEHYSKQLEDKVERLQEQLNEANEVIKHYSEDENWCDYYDDDDEKMTKSLYINCDGPLTAKVYLKKWGVK